MKVQMTSDYYDFKIGQVYDVSESVASRLVALGVAMAVTDSSDVGQ